MAELKERDSIAEKCTNMEVTFESIAGTMPGQKTTDAKYTVLDVFMFEASDRSCPKAVAVKDDDGNVFVHFNGTQDGEWIYNTAAYGAEPQPSLMQAEALEWFEGFIEKNYEGQSRKNLYVSGHSQGGNNAQFVTMRSQYADYITNCFALDAPGFSEKFVDDTMQQYGEAYYERQRSKIWAYNGENDYVSCLGQVSIIPQEHITYLEYTDPNNIGFDFVNFHAAPGLLSQDGKIKLKESNEDSELRKLVAFVFEKVKLLPPEQQAQAAITVMKILEDTEGNIRVFDRQTEGNFDDEFNELKKALVPLIVETLAEDRDQLCACLYEIGMSTEAVDAISVLLSHINSYPPDIREDIVKGILGLVKYDEEKHEFGLGLDWREVPQELFVLFTEALPVILETVITHPDDLFTILHEFGVDAAIETWVKKNPWQFVGASILVGLTAPIWAPIAIRVTAFELIADAVIRIVQGIREISSRVKDAVTQIFGALKNTVVTIVNWFRNTFDVGVRYANSNPYFKVDTLKLRNYANRIHNVNQRLRNLDSNMRGLYWQVGLLDLWNILCANLLTSGSSALNQVRAYLDNTAERFETVENNVRRNLGG